MLVRLKVYGNRALFKRPEFRRDKVSYDIITPAAARGIFDAIHWRPAIRWDVERVYLMNEIRFDELAVGSARYVMLRNVSYILEARMVMTDRAGPMDEPERHRGMFKRQAGKGADVHFGAPEYPANAALVDDDEFTAAVPLTRDLGWMFHSQDHECRTGMRFFRAFLENGVLAIPSVDAPGATLG